MEKIIDIYISVKDYIEGVPYYSYIIKSLIITLMILLLVIYIAKKLCKYGYEYSYYFLNQIHNFEYYNNKSLHIDSLYDKKYRRIRFLKNFFLFTKNTKKELAYMAEFYEYAYELTQYLTVHFDKNHYFAFSELIKHNDAENNIKSLISHYSCKGFGKVIRQQQNNKEFDWRGYIDNPFETNLEEMRISHDKKFVQKELRENTQFFDTVLKYKLDLQQRESIVKLEDNCQVISSAGSGKTSISIAKVKYLIEKRGYKEDEILALSYNTATAEEFRNRLGLDNVQVRTFHSLARQIVTKAESQKPDIRSKSFLIDCFYDLATKNPEYKENINTYLSKKQSATQLEHYYKNAQDYYRDRALYGVLCPYTDRNGKLIFTRSEEEKKICVWLTENGIKFEYESPYIVEIKDPQHKIYRPDFKIFSEDGNHFLYYEHFGIDKNGDVPVWFESNNGSYIEANRIYKEGIKWKRDTHSKNKTALIETTSAMFHEHTIFDNLKKQLEQYNIKTRPLTEDEKFQKLTDERGIIKENLKQFFETFFALMKSNGKKIDSIMEEVNKEKNIYFIERNRFLLYKIIQPLYEKYEEELKRRKLRDFVDLINNSVEYIKRGSYIPKFKYILVDEFQDISIDRFTFLQALRTKEPLTKLYCVGDDWQSIYRFSGSDINLFSKFEKFFGFTEKCKIETTYRFGNPLIEESSRFIQQNPNQVTKKVRPFSDNNTLIDYFPFSDDKNHHFNIIKSIINNIPSSESILLVGRYNKEVNVLPSKNIVFDDEEKKKATVTCFGRTIKFMSIHASKGLEADHVIVLNCNSDHNAFPSRIEDDPILGYVLCEIDNFSFSEERRLFYVAITRAKKHTYVLYRENSPSLFVTEMMTHKASVNDTPMQNNDYELICPHCKTGRLVMKSKGCNQGNNKEWRLYKCSNSVANCDFTWYVHDIRDSAQVKSIYNMNFKYRMEKAKNHKYIGPASELILNKAPFIMPKPFVPKQALPCPPAPKGIEGLPF